MSSDIASEAAPAGLSGHAFSSLFQAVAGLRNRRALVAMLGCMFVGVIVAGLLMAMSRTLGVFAGLLAMIVWVVAIGTGVNAAGLLQMDHARGISPRSTADALVYGLMCIPKLIVLGGSLASTRPLFEEAMRRVIARFPFPSSVEWSVRSSGVRSTRCYTPPRPRAGNRCVTRSPSPGSTPAMRPAAS